VRVSRLAASAVLATVLASGCAADGGDEPVGVPASPTSPHRASDALVLLDPEPRCAARLAIPITGDTDSLLAIFGLAPPTTSPCASEVAP
jgi:hypothetical protein